MLRLDGQKSESRLHATVEIVTGAGDVLEFREFRKTATTRATRVPVPFEVETLEGLHTGKAGDWLAIGAHGEMYPIDAAVFEDTYEPVDASN